MKVLQINVVYKFGSTGRIVYDIHSALIKNAAESIVCYGRGKKEKERNIYKLCSELYAKINHFIAKVDGILFEGCFFSTNKLIRIIKKNKPDVVHLHCINGYFVNAYRLINWLKKNRVKTVLTLHAEFMYTGGCSHSVECMQWRDESCENCKRWKKATGSFFVNNTAYMFRRMKDSFNGFEDYLDVVSVSPWLMKRASESIILRDMKHRVILNGVDTSVFYPRDYSDIKKIHNLHNKKIVFHATPEFSLDPTNLKGGLYVKELAERLIDENIVFIVAGPFEADIKVPSNMIMLGKVTDPNLLAKYYSVANVTVLTSKRETFSMVTAESLCCGTPVVGFKAGGPEQITIDEYSAFSEYGDIEVLLKNAEVYIERPKNSLLPDIAKEKYSKERMIEEYMNLYFHKIEV